MSSLHQFSRYYVEKQTDKHVNTTENPTHATIVGIGNKIVCNTK